MFIDKQMHKVIENDRKYVAKYKVKRNLFFGSGNEIFKGARFFTSSYCPNFDRP